MKLPRHLITPAVFALLACEGGSSSIGQTQETPSTNEVSEVDREEAAAAAARWVSLSAGQMDAGGADVDTFDGGVFVPGGASNTSPPGVLERQTV